MQKDAALSGSSPEEKIGQQQQRREKGRQKKGGKRKEEQNWKESKHFSYLIRKGVNKGGAPWGK